MAKSFIHLNLQTPPWNFIHYKEEALDYQKFTPVVGNPLDQEFLVNFLKVLLNGGSPLLSGQAPSGDYKLPQQSIGISTSGSSGKPKIILFTLKSLEESLQSYFSFFPFYERDNKSLVTLPMNHMGGLMVALRAIYQKTSLKYLGNLSLEEALTKIGPNQISLVPTQIKKIKNLDLLKQLDYLLIGGAGMEREDLKELRAKGIKVSPSYGSTESLAVVAAQHPDRPNDNPGLAEVLPKRILGKCNPLEIGDFGRAYGELRDNDIHLFGEFFQTKDQVELNENHLIFKKRLDLIFISGGKNLNPISMEERFHKNSQGIKGLFLPIKDEHWGEKNILLTDQLIDIHSDHYFKLLNNFEKPKDILYCPLLKSGKPNRYQLKAWAQKELKKPALLFLHGFMGSFKDANFLINQEDFRVSTLTLPGHGHKTLPSRFEDIIQTIKETLINRNFDFLYGYSLGGRIASEVANQTTLKGLILESSSLRFHEDIEKRKHWEESLFSKVGDEDEFLSHWYDLTLFQHMKKHKHYPALIEQIKQNGGLSQWKKAMDFYSPRHRGHNIEHLITGNFPMLYIYGQEDKKYSKQAQELATFKLATLKEIKEADHNCHFLSPQKVVEAIASFILEHL